MGTASQPASSQSDESDTVTSNVAPEHAASSSSSVTGNAEASQEEMGDEAAASSSEGESQAPGGSGGPENSSGSQGYVPIQSLWVSYLVKTFLTLYFCRSTSHTTEYATLLDNLHQFHARLAPHLERYRNFMREDPVVSSEVRKILTNSIGIKKHVTLITMYFFVGHTKYSDDDKLGVRNSALVRSCLPLSQ